MLRFSLASALRSQPARSVAEIPSERTLTCDRYFKNEGPGARNV